jgi:hypothetical protein
LILCSDLFLGLPDFFRYKIPKPEKYTKWSRKIPNAYKTYQVAVK